MKSLFTILSLVLFFSFINAQNKDFDQKLADSLGADQYGMKSYYLVILKKGKAEINDKARKSELMKGHMENINKLAKDGKLIVAGPMAEKNDKNYSGIFILDAKTKEEAESLVLTDPSVKSGIFDVEIYKWYGSAALPLYLKSHDKVTKVHF
ncbi:YciI family protein [Epilithonimonas caeni]|uniref:YciI family protein n=1 Tax=Epilithonimonas caeni TaxID=365343 RepID=UPI000419F10E|nr:YciI family protein [Epilithonimonas caeni]